MIQAWDWNASNGTATAAQTQTAYVALTSQGVTTNVAHEVWNDIINKIDEVSTALGYVWWAKHATKTLTYVNQALGELTARKFNSARLNTKYPWWSWAKDPSQEGYVGREDFYGVTEVGEAQADKVYGRYIIELLKNINILIGIINETQTTADLSGNLPLVIHASATISDLYIKLYAHAHASTSHTAKVYEALSSLVLAFGTIASKVKAQVTNGAGESLQAASNGNAATLAELSLNGALSTIYEAILTAHVVALTADEAMSMSAKRVVDTSYIADAESYDTETVKALSASATGEQAATGKAETNHTEAVGKSEAAENAELFFSIPNLLLGVANANAENVAELTVTEDVWYSRRNENIIFYRVYDNERDGDNLKIG